jgi:hypothetical protein
MMFKICSSGDILVIRGLDTDLFTMPKPIHLERISQASPVVFRFARSSNSAEKRAERAEQSEKTVDLTEIAPLQSRLQCI